MILKSVYVCSMVCVCGMVCACGYAIACFQVHLHMCVYSSLWGPKGDTEIFTCWLFICVFPRQGLSQSPSSSAELDSLANELQRSTCATPTPNAEVTEVCHHAWHFTKVSSNPHTCEANTLQTEPSLQPKHHI